MPSACNRIANHREHLRDKHEHEDYVGGCNVAAAPRMCLTTRKHNFVTVRPNGLYATDCGHDGAGYCGAPLLSRTASSWYHEPKFHPSCLPGTNATDNYVGPKTRVVRIEHVGVNSLRYFAKYEFTIPHLLCASDCESLTMSELLEGADVDCLKLWNNLSMSYTTSNGLQELRDAISATQYKTITANELLIAAPEELIYLTICALLKPGDTCIVTFPGYQSLYEVARSRGVNVKFWEPRYTGSEDSGSTEKGRLKFDVGDLKQLAAETGKFEMLVINFPHNPTGACLSAYELNEVAMVANEHNAWLFSDEMYRGLELDRENEHPSAADMHDVHEQTIVLGGMSKTYGCPGLRIGWLATHQAHALDSISIAKDYTSICCCAPGEVLAAMALRRATELEERNMQLVLGNIAVATDILGGLGDLIEWHPPEGGSMGFPRLKAPNASVDEWSDGLVRGAGVLVLPASVYGHAPSVANNHFRIGLGRSDFSECMHVLEKHVQAAAVPA